MAIHRVYTVRRSVRRSDDWVYSLVYRDRALSAVRFLPLLYVQLNNETALIPEFADFVCNWSACCLLLYGKGDYTTGIRIILATSGQTHVKSPERPLCYIQ